MKRNFNKEDFAYLLKKAIGTRKQSEFAKETGLTKEHLCRFINQRLEVGPSLATLNRIAEHTTEVSWNELYVAAGYSVEVDYAQSTISKQEALSIKLINATILSALIKQKSAWTIGRNHDEGDRYLSICLEDAPIHHWYFHYITHDLQPSIQQHLKASYVDLVFHDFEPEDKYTFVTASSTEYDAYKESPPKNLNLNISVMLVNTETLNIVEETLLQKNTAMSEQGLRSLIL